MKEEYIVKRTKLIAVKNILVLIAGILILILFIIIPIDKIVDNQAKAIFLKVFKVITVLMMPIIFLALISHIKYLFSNEPILIINEEGITDRTNSNKKIGPIIWDDILYMKVVPYMNNVVYICLKLKDPSKYVNPNLFNRINKLKSTLDVNIYSLYFKGKEQIVIDLINKYLENKNNTDE